MMNSKTEAGGRKIADRGNRSLSQDAVRLFKTQDASYLRNMMQITKKDRRKLEEQLISEDAIHSETIREDNVNCSRHLVFVDHIACQKDTNLDMASGHIDMLEPQFTISKHEKMIPPDVARLAELVDSQVPAEGFQKAKQRELSKTKSRDLRKQLLRQRQMKESILNSLKRREDDVMAADWELDIQRGRMHNSIGGTTQTGFKFKLKERKQ